MTQADLNRAVAEITGETVSTISQLGFLIDEPAGRFDSDRNDPDVIDWDALDANRTKQPTWSPTYAPAVA